MGDVEGTAAYVDQAKLRLIEALKERTAMVWHEVQAVLAEARGTTARNIDPHHLTTARQGLLKAGVIVQDEMPTRGGRPVRLLELSDPLASKRESAAVAARKRLLYARYLGWASGTSTKTGIIGVALERAVHESLMLAAPEVGYRVENPKGGQTGHVGAVVLAPSYGPLDNAFRYFNLDTGRSTRYQSRPRTSVTGFTHGPTSFISCSLRALISRPISLRALWSRCCCVVRHISPFSRWRRILVSTS